MKYAIPAVEARAARAISEGRALLTEGAAPLTVAMHLRDAYVDMVMMEAALAVAASDVADRAWAATVPPAQRLRVVDGRTALGQVRRTTVTAASRRFTPLPKGHPMRLSGGAR